MFRLLKPHLYRNLLVLHKIQRRCIGAVCLDSFSIRGFYFFQNRNKGPKLRASIAPIIHVRTISIGILISYLLILRNLNIRLIWIFSALQNLLSGVWRSSTSYKSRRCQTVKLYRPTVIFELPPSGLPPSGNTGSESRDLALQYRERGVKADYLDLHD